MGGENGVWLNNLNEWLRLPVVVVRILKDRGQTGLFYDLIKELVMWTHECHWNFRYFSDFIRLIFGVGFSKILVIEDFSNDCVPLEACVGGIKLQILSIYITAPAKEMKGASMSLFSRKTYIYFILNRFMVSVCV